MAKTDDPRDVRDVAAGDPIRGPWLTGAAKGLDNERRKPPNLPRLHARRSFEAKIATEVGDGEYTFTAQHLPEWDGSQIDWLTPEDGNFHPKTGTCYEANHTTGIAVDTIIHVREIRGLDGLPFYGFFRAVTPPLGWTTAIAGTKYNINDAGPQAVGIEISYTNGVLDHEEMKYDYFELSGDDTVATPILPEGIVSIGLIAGFTADCRNFMSGTIAKILCQFVTASWDVVLDTDWAERPSVAGGASGTMVEIRGTIADNENFDFRAERLVKGGLVNGLGTTIYGIRTFMTITDPDPAGTTTLEVGFDSAFGTAWAPIS